MMRGSGKLLFLQPSITANKAICRCQLVCLHRLERLQTQMKNECGQRVNWEQHCFRHDTSIKQKLRFRKLTRFFLVLNEPVMRSTWATLLSSASARWMRGLTTKKHYNLLAVMLAFVPAQGSIWHA